MLSLLVYLAIADTITWATKQRKLSLRLKKKRIRKNKSCRNSCCRTIFNLSRMHQVLSMQSYTCGHLLKKMLARIIKQTRIVAGSIQMLVYLAHNPKRHWLIFQTPKAQISRIQEVILTNPQVFPNQSVTSTILEGNLLRLA